MKVKLYPVSFLCCKHFCVSYSVPPANSKANSLGRVLLQDLLSLNVVRSYFYF